MDWQPSIAGDLALWAVEVARDVSERLSDEHIVERAAELSLSQTAFPKSAHWLSYSISQGYAGLALLWSYLDACFPNEGWDVRGRRDLERAARDAEARVTLPPGLFSGLSGLGFAAWQLSRGGTRYQRLLTSLDEVIVPGAIQLAEDLPAQENGVNIADFDVISGLSGIGAYLLCRRDQAEVATGIRTVIAALVDLVSGERALPRWYTPYRLLWDQELRDRYPNGNLNCGLAHGLPGILAFLSLCVLRGTDVSGLREAVATAASWLASHRCDDDWGINWTTAVPVIETPGDAGNEFRADSGSSAPDGTSRCAWCYGSPGIARSLWLAGKALGDECLQQLAITAMEAVFRRPWNQRRIDSPTFCHGKAGLLQITLRFLNDTGGDIFREESAKLVRELLLAYEPRSLLGYRNTETPGHEIDQPGLLDGAPGVALVLLAASSGEAPDWDRLFLLS